MGLKDTVAKMARGKFLGKRAEDDDEKPTAEEEEDRRAAEDDERETDAEEDDKDPDAEEDDDEPTAEGEEDEPEAEDEDEPKKSRRRAKEDDKDPDAEDEDESKDMRRGRRAERVRIKSILGRGSKAPALAAHLAFDTSMSGKKCRSILRYAPKNATGPSLGRRMRGRNPNLGTGGKSGGGGSHNDRLVAFAQDRAAKRTPRKA